MSPNLWKFFFLNFLQASYHNIDYSELSCSQRNHNHSHAYAGGIKGNIRTGTQQILVNNLWTDEMPNSQVKTGLRSVNKADTVYLT